MLCLILSAHYRVRTTGRGTFDISDLTGRGGAPGATASDALVEVVSDDEDELFYDAWRRSWAERLRQTGEERIGHDPTALQPDWAFSWWIEAATGPAR